MVERELQRDQRGAEGADRRHLPQARELAELALERGRHRRGHDVGAGPRVEGEDLDRRVVDLRQGGDWELEVGDSPGEEDARRQQGSRHRAEDEGAGGIHGTVTWGGIPSSLGAVLGFLRALQADAAAQLRLGVLAEIDLERPPGAALMVSDLSVIVSGQASRGKGEPSSRIARGPRPLAGRAPRRTGRGSARRSGSSP